MANFKLTIQYDGTAYEGWQAQKRADSVTIQETLESALADLFQKPIVLTGAGRTDSGVHALGQVANFRVETNIPCYQMARAINVRLPEDISVIGVEEVNNDFHARISAIGKHYRYTILNHSLPHAYGNRYFYQSHYTLDETLVREACTYLEGTHDYTAFCAAGSQVEDKVRTVYRVNLLRKENYWFFDFYGEGFLRNMVRIMTGTLLEIGAGRLDKECITKAYETGERALLGKTVPAKGLCLKKVFYK